MGNRSGRSKEAGIPVILSDRQMQLSDDSLYEAWVGGNFVKEGETCGDWLADYLEKQGRADEEINMVTIQGNHRCICTGWPYRRYGEQLKRTFQLEDVRQAVRRIYTG